MKRSKRFREVALAFADEAGRRNFVHPCLKPRGAEFCPRRHGVSPTSRPSAETGLLELATSGPRQLAAEPTVGPLDFALGPSMRELGLALDRPVTEWTWPADVVVEAVSLDRHRRALPSVARSAHPGDACRAHALGRSPDSQELLALAPRGVSELVAKRVPPCPKLGGLRLNLAALRDFCAEPRHRSRFVSRALVRHGRAAPARTPGPGRLGAASPLAHRCAHGPLRSPARRRHAGPGRASSSHTSRSGIGGKPGLKCSQLPPQFADRARPGSIVPPTSLAGPGSS